MTNQVLKLLEPITIGQLTVRNRTFMSAMNENMCSMDGAPTDHQIAYYEARAKGGVGLVITGNAFVDQWNSQIASGQLGVYSDRLIPHLNRLAETVQKAGARIVMQLVHGGRQASFAWNHPLWAPSALVSPVVGIETKEMTYEEIKLTIHNFIQGARRAHEAGFDGVEVHLGHGYLLSEFLSPHTNQRNDEYGGSLENNARMGLEIIEGIKKLVPAPFIVGVKMNGHEAVENGVTLEMASKYAQWFEQAGADYITVSAGTYESGDEQCQSLYIDRGFNVHLAEAIKRIVSIPVTAVGSINDPMLAEDILQKGKADIITIGRPLIADPEFVNKIANGAYEDIRKCIRCNDCQGRLVENRVITCAINPEVGKEREYKIELAAKKKKVLVVGGGPGGMEVARVSALRGHQVVLLERKAQLGGTCLPINNPGFKKELENIPAYYNYQYTQLGVDVRVNTEVTSQLIADEAPDVVVLATGAIPLSHDIAGDGSIPIVQALDYFNQVDQYEQKRIAVIGAGLVGCEAALKLAVEGNKVSLITRRPQAEAAKGLNALAAFRLITEMEKYGVEIVENSEVVSIEKERAIIRHIQSGKSSEREFDLIVPARGFVPNGELEDEVKSLVTKVYAIGDRVKPRTILDAIAEGAYIARQL